MIKYLKITLHLFGFHFYQNYCSDKNCKHHVFCEICGKAKYKIKGSR